MIDREVLQQVLRALDDTITYGGVTYDGPTAEHWKEAASRINAAGGQEEYLTTARDSLAKEMEVGTGIRWFIDLPDDESQGNVIAIAVLLDIDLRTYRNFRQFIGAVRYRIIDMLEQIHEK